MTPIRVVFYQLRDGQPVYLMATSNAELASAIAPGRAVTLETPDANDKTVRRSYIVAPHTWSINTVVHRNADWATMYVELQSYLDDETTEKRLHKLEMMAWQRT